MARPLFTPAQLRLAADLFPTNEDQSTSSSSLRSGLSSLSLAEQQVVSRGLDECLAEDKAVFPGTLHSLEIIPLFLSSVPYTHIPGNGGEGVRVRLFLSHGDYEPRTEIVMYLSLSVLAAHFCDSFTSGPWRAATQRVRSARERDGEHRCAIDYLPLHPGEFRVYESKRVHCSLRHPLPAGETEKTTEPKRRKGSVHEGGDGGGLVFVRDSRTSAQLCGRCIALSIQSGNPLGGLVNPGSTNDLMGKRATF